MSDLNLDGLYATEAAMTGGEWMAHGPYETNGRWAIASYVRPSEPETGYDGTEPIHCIGNHWNGDCDVPTWGILSEEDARGIVAMRNAFRQLLDEVKRLREENSRLRSFVFNVSRQDPFGEHATDPDVAPCDMVFQSAAYAHAARKALRLQGVPNAD